MYVIFQAGGHQYKVSVGDELVIDRVNDKKRNDRIIFDRVLFLFQDGESHIGKPYVANAKVEVEVVEQARAPKIIVFKYKRRKTYKVTRGHKQPITKIRVADIRIDIPS